MIALLHAFAVLGFLIACALLGGLAMHHALHGQSQPGTPEGRRSLLSDVLHDRL